MGANGLPTITERVRNTLERETCNTEQIPVLKSRGGNGNGLFAATRSQDRTTLCGKPHTYLSSNRVLEASHSGWFPFNIGELRLECI